MNAGRSKVNADYAAVKEQTGIAMNSSDVVVAKASRFDEAYFTTATPEDNQTVFKEGVTTTDIQNHMNYKGDAINVGLGAGINSETQKVSPPGISGIGYGKDGDSQTSTTYSAVTGIAGKSDVTTANVSSLNKPLENSFDKTTVEAQLGAQVQVSQAFDTERRTYRLEMAKDEEKLRKEAKEALVKGDEATWRAKTEQANKQQEEMVLFDSITGAIYGPNTNGVTGYVARAVAPRVSYQIGQYFKGTNGEGTAPHILAHGILAAAVSSATGNDPTTGALSAMGAEAGAKYVANYLFPDTKLSELTAEQKATVSSITSLAGLGLGATAGSITDAVSASEASKTAVENNQFSLPPIPDNVYNRLMAVSNSMSMGLGVPISNWVNGYQVVDTNNPIYTKTGMVADAIMIITPGGGVKVVAKGTRETVGIYKNVKEAEIAIQKVKVRANIGRNNPNYNSISQEAISSRKMPADIYGSKKVITEGITTKGTKIQSIPNGTKEQAFKDFNSLNLKDVKTIQTNKGEMKMGELPDGRTVKVRPSNDAGRGRYTIDIIKKNNRTEREIRYGKRN